MPQRPNPDFSLEILKLLDAAHSEAGGASGKVLLDHLKLDSLIKIEPSLLWLRDVGFIKVGLRMFVITDDGRSYLKEHS